MRAEILTRVNERLTVGMKVGVLLLVLLAVAGVNVGVVYYFQTQTDTLGNSVDIAGQQRMLSQRMAYVSFMISQGHDDQQLLVDAVDRYNRNLRALEDGGTVNDLTLDPAPAAVSAELEQEQDAWSTYEQHARTVAETDPYNPEFRASLEYVLEHDDDLQRRSDAIVQAYADADGAYADERSVAVRQQLISHRISKTALEMSELTSRPGSEAAEKLSTQDSSRMRKLQSRLQTSVADYEATLDVLENGGTYRGKTLDPAPESVQAEIADARSTWSEFGGHATALASVNRLNPEFWESLSYIETHTDELYQTSASLVDAYAHTTSEQYATMRSVLVGLFAFDVVVFLLGTLIGRRYIGRPIREIADVADALADGDLDVEVTTEAVAGLDDEQRRDEISALSRSFTSLHEYLTTVAEQASALADQEFDAAVLDEDIPGEFGHALDRMRQDLEALIDEIEASREEAEAMSRALEEDAAEYSAVMDATAAGDLTRRMDPESQSEAMAAVAASFNAMLDELEPTVARVTEFADAVADASDQATASTEEVKVASEEVSVAVQEISDGSQRQNENLQDVLTEMNDLSATIEEIASASDEVAGVSDRAAEQGRTGSTLAEEAIDEMHRAEEKTDQSVEEIAALDDQMEEIEDVVTLIDGIAEQTNLLALNANIEAARAGESGEGFAVVADEVKSLAEDTRDATEEVAHLIDEIQAQTETSVSNMRETRERVSEGVETVDAALGAFEDTVEQIEEANVGVQEIDDATDEQAASTEETVTMVDEVASISEETTSEAENVAAAAEEQAASLTEVSGHVTDLSARAADLTTLLAGFTARTDDVETGVEDAPADGEPATGDD